MRILFLNTVGGSLSKLNADCLLFLAGVFNCTENYYLDRNHLEPHSASKKALKQMIEAHDLCDVWRNIHPDTTEEIACPWQGWIESMSLATRLAL